LLELPAPLPRRLLPAALLGLVAAVPLGAPGLLAGRMRWRCGAALSGRSCLGVSRG
jgi:hypothetical protein